MLRNADGTPYKASGELNLYQEQKSLSLMNFWDAEAIRIGGSPIYYYEVFIQKGTLDPLYLEDRGKIFSNYPIKLYTVYEPIPSQNYQNAFGIDSPDEIIFELNYKDVLNKLGHPPKVGSRLHTPHLGEDWVIIQRNLGEFKLWGALRLNLLCARFQESVTTGEGKVTQTKPDYEID